MVNGEVIVNDVPMKKSKLYRFCEKRIDKWYKNQAGLFIESDIEPGIESGENEIQFKVEFTEEDECRQVSCVTEISMQGMRWRGCDLGTDTQNAFIQSLKRLQNH